MADTKPSEVMGLIKDMNIDQLAEVRKGIDQQLKQRKKDAAKEVRQRVKELSEQLGMPVQELMDQVAGKGVGGRSTGKIAPKFINPENPAQTWSGRGAKPVWLREELQKGKKLEDFAINATQGQGAPKQTPPAAQATKKPEPQKAQASNPQQHKK